jgi:hypothetical protein
MHDFSCRSNTENYLKDNGCEGTHTFPLEEPSSGTSHFLAIALNKLRKGGAPLASALDDIFLTMP